VAARYRDGFSECAQEVDRFLASVSGLGGDTRYRLMNHLAACIKQPVRRASIHSVPAPAAFHAGAPALNPAAVYPAVQLPPDIAPRVDFTSGSESSVPSDVMTSSVDIRRRSVSVAAAPYTSRLFPGLSAMTGRLSACPLFPVISGGDDERSATTLLSFRPIQPASDSDELDAEMTCCDAGSDVDDDVDTGPSSASREVASGRALTEKNDNVDNIARGLLGTHRRDGASSASDAGTAAAGDEESVMMLMMKMRDDVKDEHVWRPW